MRVAVLASGDGTNLQALLDRCHGTESSIALVVSDTASAGALTRARAAGVPTHVLNDPKDGDSLNHVLRSHRIDLAVLAGYMRLIPAAVVATLHERMINLHPALLPAFGGPGMYGSHVHRAVLASGATVSGASVHLVTEEYDRGPIVAQWPVPVRADDTPDSLAARIHIVEHQLLPAVVQAAARAGRVVRLTPKAEAFDLGAEPRDIAERLVPAES